MTRRQVKRLILVLGAVFVAVFGVLVLKQKSPSGGEEPVVVNTYDECVAAGFAIMETDPPQCRDAEGNLFVGPTLNNIGDDEDPEVVDGVLVLHSLKGVTLKVTEPELDGEIATPTVVRGEVPGTWSFEANFGIDVVDANGVVLGTGIATLLDDWMTEGMVKFEASLAFTTPETPNGKLLLHRANPSGEPENDDWAEMTVNFAQ